MKTSVARQILTLAVVATTLTSIFACGKEGKLKECAEHCRSAAEECSKHHDRECEEKGRRCGEQCEKELK